MISPVLCLTGLSRWLLSPEGSCGLDAQDGALPWLAVGAGSREVSWAANWSTSILCMWLGLLLHGSVQETQRPRGGCKLFSDLTSDILEYHFRCILVAKGVSKACQPRGALWRRIRSALDGRVSVSAHYTGAGGMGGVGMVVLGKCSLPQGGRVQTNSPTKV